MRDLEKEIEDGIGKTLCINYTIARSQRISEYSRGLGDEGTLGYAIRGCYDCEGTNKQCEIYFEVKRWLHL